MPALMNRHERYKLPSFVLNKAIEIARAEMMRQLHETGYNFTDPLVIKSSQELDRLINLYHHFINKEKPKAIAY